MSAQKEVPKRLEPTGEVLRELFLKSGNLCAFPGCKSFMMNEEGVFVGQICHIEAAIPGGERFNEKASNEQRREIGNLMLMCYEHHTVTNDIEKYSAPRLKEMKQQHEAKFYDVANKMQNAIIDQATTTDYKTAVSLHKLNEVLRWRHDDDMLAYSLMDLKDLQDRLRKLAKPTRQLLVSIVGRTPLEGGGPISWTNGREFYPFEIQHACGLSDEILYGHLQTLRTYKVIDVDDSEGNDHWFLLKIGDEIWDVWKDFQEFCKKSGFTLTELIVDLNFGLLD